MATDLPRVVVIGGTYVDIAVRCEQIPAAGQTVAGAGFSYSPTGPGLNQAIEAALCDCEVHLICKLGADLFGQIVKNCLANYKINSDFVYSAEAKTTGAIVTMVDAMGEDASCKCIGANIALTAQDIEAAEQVIATANVCLIHGELPQDAISAAIRCAKLHGTKVILNPARPVGYVEEKVETLPIEYFSADILIPNLYEAADITEQPATNIKAAKLIGSELVMRGAGAAVITMGKRGCMVVDRNGADHIPAFEIDLVDQTCTGDAFAGALAACSTVEKDIRKAVRFASAAGALACTKFGTIDALPTKEEIIELLQNEDMK